MDNENIDGGRIARRSSMSSLAESLQSMHSTASTIQEMEVEDVPGPLQPVFWKPQNIMSVEDTPFSNRYLVTLQVVFGSVLGNLARVGLTELTKYNNEYIHFSLGTCLWSNFTACFFMAWCNHAVGFWSNVMRNSGKTNMKQLALHSGITAGFCGTFSTWSSLLIEQLLKTLDAVNGGASLPHPRYRVMEFFSVLFVQMGVSFLGYFLGKDFAALVDMWAGSERLYKWFNYSYSRVFELLTSFVGILAVISQLVLTCALPLSNSWKKNYSLVIVFGMFGTLLRFRLSTYNGRFAYKWFPYGTLMANIIACAFLAVLYLLLYGYNADGSRIITKAIHQLVIRAFITGFCGSLSTTSSLVNEIHNLEYPTQRYVYFAITYLTCFVPMLIIDGTYHWTRGFANF